MSGKRSEKTPKRQEKGRRRHPNRLMVFSLSLAGSLTLLLLFVVLFEIREVEVVGNDHYTAKEVQETVMDGLLEKNALFLWLRNRGRKLSGDTFIDTVTVDFTAPWAVRIRVEEKKLAGYLREGETYWYFDGAGIVRTSSAKSELESFVHVRGRTFEGGCRATKEGLLDIGDTLLRPGDFNDGGNYIPFVRGIVLSEAPALGQPLGKGSGGPFGIIAAVKDYIDKCSFRPDSVEITPEGRTLLHIRDVSVDLGSDGRVEVKLRELEGIYPKLAGRRGTLHLENYDGTKNRVIFTEDTKE